VGAARLAALPIGGRTPIVAGLAKAADVLRAERRRDPDRAPLLVLVTDGRATHGGDPLPAARALVASTGGTSTGGNRLTSVVVDCESGFVRLGLAGRLATALGARLVPLDALRAGGPGDPGRPPARPERTAA
jgi:magnesium chelatase subunit D